MEVSHWLVWLVGGQAMRCHEESRRFRLMRNRRGEVDEDEDDEDEDEEDTREASRSRASWFLYQRILSAEIRMNSFLGWSGPALWRLEGLGEVTRAIVCVGWLVMLEWKVLAVEEKSCPRRPPGEVLGSWFRLLVVSAVNR